METLTEDVVSIAEWVQRAKSIAPVVQQYRDDSEQQRYMAQPIFDAIRQIGINQMSVPRAFGGPQAEPLAQLRVIEEIARQDGSTGWNVLIWVGTGLFSDYLAEDVAQELFGNGQEIVIGGALNPTAQARPVPGGLRVTGRWAFGSGYHYLTTLVAGCVVMDGEHPRMLDNGMPEMYVVLLSPSECEMIDTWHTAGLRGTGSHDFRAADVFVPMERAIPLSAFFVGPTARPSTALRTPFYDFASTQIATVGLGIARDAIESFKSLASGKIPAIGTTSLGNLQTIQQRVGRAEALLRAARAYLFTTVEEVTSAHQAGSPVRDDDSADLRLAAAHAAQNAVEVVDLMFDAGGGSSIYATNRLERCFRDVHMVPHHMMVSPLNVEMVGQYLLGGPLQVRR